ncbi:regulator of secondary metabolism [Colletotrichum tofieldiae]|nr:regulator of secondary metabolism [Colletotrichum tofieldiae]
MARQIERYGGKVVGFEFYKEAYEHLKSGCYLEIEALNLELLCDSGGSTLESEFFLDHLILPNTGDDKQHLNFEKTKELLESAGFVNIKEEVINLPINPWREDERDRELGQRFNMVLQFLLKTGQYAPPDLDSNAPAWEEIYTLGNRGYCRL